VLFQALAHWEIIKIMEEIDPKLESLLKFLADYQSAQGTLFGKFVTAGKLADIRELERMFALGCEEPSPAIPCTAITVRRHE
jgi:hypothetical protein